jgi:sugar phosphate isomerase/epimerase
MSTPEPQLSVIEFTTPMLTFAQDLETYRRAGFEAIGISENKLSDDRADLEQLRASGLVASSFFPAAGSILPRASATDEADPELRIATLVQSIHRVAPFGPAVCFVIPGPLGRYESAEAWERVVDGCRTLASAAANEGMRLAVEIMHPTLAEEFSFLTSLQDGIRLIDDVDEPNVALALDLWHLDPDADDLADVRQHASRVASVHVNDRRDPTRSWCDRVLPGDGTLDLVGILGSLDQGGFRGWFELEVISDDGRVEHDFPDSLWRRDPVELVSAGRTQFLALWERRERAASAEMQEP